MAFDENYHVGIIRIYAHQWSPFFAHQPPGADQYSALTRDPSYLYHYLMSFPDRIVTQLTSSVTTEILTLRFINVALMVWALFLFRKLLLRTKAPVTWVHLVLLYFIMIPVVPFLAAQVNYDNLMIPLTALSLLLTVDLVALWRQEKTLNLGRLLALLGLVFLSALVTYPFLPFLVAIVAYLAWELFQLFRRSKEQWPQLIGSAWRRMSLAVKVSSILLFGLGLGLFLERDGYNTIAYGTPVPQCNQVLSIEQCKAYGPWYRNYQFELSKQKTPVNPFPFIGTWFHGMFQRSFFAVDGPETNYITRYPLPIIYITSIVLASGGALLIGVYGRKILRNYPVLRFLLAASMFYLIILFLQNYHYYEMLDQTVAINGRYLFPALVPLLLAVALAYRELMRRWQPWLKASFITLIFLLFLQGAGAMTFILRSNADWYWPNNQLVWDMNHWARAVLSHVVLR